MSTDPELRARQLANLPNMRGELPATAWTTDDSPALVHGGRTTRPPRAVLDPVVAEIIEALEPSVPLRDADGEVPATDRVAVELAAVALLTVRRVHGYLAENGEVDARGRLRIDVLKLAGSAEERLARRLADLGMTPRSRAALGLDLTRAVTADERLRSHVADRYGGGGAPAKSPSGAPGGHAHPSTGASPKRNPSLDATTTASDDLALVLPAPAEPVDAQAPPGAS